MLVGRVHTYHIACVHTVIHPYDILKILKDGKFFFVPWPPGNLKISTSPRNNRLSLFYANKQTAMPEQLLRAANTGDLIAN
jgi:hypothetical protein